MNIEVAANRRVPGGCQGGELGRARNGQGAAHVGRPEVGGANPGGPRDVEVAVQGGEAANAEAAADGPLPLSVSPPVFSDPTESSPALVWAVAELLR